MRKSNRQDKVENTRGKVNKWTLIKSRGHDEATTSGGHHDTTQPKKNLTQDLAYDDCDFNFRWS